MTNPRSLVLIVDDEPSGRETLQSILSTGPYELACACDGTEALELAHRLHPDLVLLDVMLPDVDGFDICRMLRSQTDLQPVPVIMISALEDHASRLRGLQSGADDFISKPFNRAELRARVRTVTELNRFRRVAVEGARFRWVIENAEDGYVVLDESGAVVVANATARHMLVGGTDTEIAGLDFLSLADAIYRWVPATGRDLGVAESTGAPEPVHLVRPASEYCAPLWLELQRYAPGEWPGREHLIRLRDVSASMATDRSMTEFHTLLAGRLRTPLLGLVTIPEWLISVEPAVSEADREQFLQLILKHGRLLRREVERILQYLRIPDFTRAAGATTVDDLRWLIGELGGEFGIEALSISAGASCEDASVRVSRKVMDLVIRELLTNSVRFHPSRSPRIDVSIERPLYDQITLRIENDGLSAPPEFLPAAWGPYRQASRSASGEDAGLGLGLSMVATLVMEAGGQCRMLNRAGGGVVFEIDLPVAAGVPCGVRTLGPRLS